MAHMLASGTCDGIKPELGFLARCPRRQDGHRQYQYAITISRIGQLPVDELGQDDISVVRPHRPLRNQDIRLILA
jgi:hypothetical protein